MKLQYFTDQFLARLRRAIPQNAQNYVSPTPWLDGFAGGTHSRETGIEIPPLRSLAPPITGDLKDVENAQVVYSDLKCLNPTEAADERIWTHLAHTHYWSYMVARWGHTTPSIVGDRFFFRTQGTGSLVRNGIARLWWFGHLTHDPARTDPFELTKILLSKQDIQTGLLQRNVGKNRKIRAATLEYFHTRQTQIEAVGQGRGGLTRVVQHLLLGLNLAGGVYLLDALQPSTLHGILDESLAEFAA